MPNKLPTIKKTLRDFLTSEEGQINGQNILKVGLTILGAGMGLAGFMNTNSSLASCSHTSHGSHGAHGSHGSHVSHCSHQSHCNHGSHGSHGSHASHSNEGPCGWYVT